MHVKVGFWYAKGDHFVDEDESAQIAIQHFEVNGRWISADVAILRNRGPFLNLYLDRRVPEGQTSPYILKSIAAVLELADELTEDDWISETWTEGTGTIEETTESVLCIPVSSMEWVDLKQFA